MKKVVIVLFVVSLLWPFSFAQNKMSGVRGEKEAIAEAVAMVKTMGGMEIWAQLKSVHLVFTGLLGVLLWGIPIMRFG